MAINLFAMPSSSIALLFSVAFGLTRAMPWAEAQKTASYQVEEWSPKPTGVASDPARIFKRSVVDVAICGWFGADSAKPAACPTGSSCIHDTLHAVIGCCTTDGPCTQGVYTSCMDQRSSGWASTSGGAVNNGVTTCSSSSACYQNTYPGNYMHYTCGDSNAATQVVTGYNNQPNDVRLQVVYTGVTFGPLPAATTKPSATATNTNTFSPDMGVAGKASPVSSGGSTAAPTASKVNAGTVAGGTIAALAGVTVIAALVFWLMRRRNKKIKERKAGFFDASRKDPFSRPLQTAQRYNAAPQPPPEDNDFVSPMTGHPDNAPKSRNLLHEDTAYHGGGGMEDRGRGHLSQHSLSTLAGGNPFADEVPLSSDQTLRNMPATAYTDAVPRESTPHVYEPLSRAPSPYMTTALAPNPYAHEVGDTSDPTPYHSSLPVTYSAVPNRKPPPPGVAAYNIPSRSAPPPPENPFADVAASNPFDRDSGNTIRGNGALYDDNATHAIVPIHPPQSYIPPPRRDTPSPTPPDHLQEANMPLVSEIEDFSRTWNETVSTPLNATRHGHKITDSIDDTYTPIQLHTATSVLVADARNARSAALQKMGSGRSENVRMEGWQPPHLRPIRSASGTEISPSQNQSQSQNLIQQTSSQSQRHPTSSLISSYRATSNPNSPPQPPLGISNAQFRSISATQPLVRTDSDVSVYTYASHAQSNSSSRKAVPGNGSTPPLPPLSFTSVTATQPIEPPLKSPLRAGQRAEKRMSFGLNDAISSAIEESQGGKYGRGRKKSLVEEVVGGWEEQGYDSVGARNEWAKLPLNDPDQSRSLTGGTGMRRDGSGDSNSSSGSGRGNAPLRPGGGGWERVGVKGKGKGEYEAVPSRRPNEGIPMLNSPSLLRSERGRKGSNGGSGHHWG
ncbi:hypothetical protein BGZ60DRAFT_525765 [Tricladium varicosporioides]|nr:hypothetical protein BGZ60DRAFT_525765 [Hymenoscyphus varicosporioides]